MTIYRPFDSRIIQEFLELEIFSEEEEREYQEDFSILAQQSTTKMKPVCTRKGMKYRWMKKGDIEKCVPHEYVDDHIKDDWSFGRIGKHGGKRGEYNAERGKKISENNKGKQTFLGRKHSEETKKKMSIARAFFHAK